MSRRPPRSTTTESDEENVIHHLNCPPGQQQSFSDISISSSRPHSSPSHSRSRSRNLSDASLNSNESEILDAVSELTPLVGNSHAYEPLDDNHHAGLSDDESINTVTALTGMIIRCHSISANSAAGRRGICRIRPSSAKVVSKYTCRVCIIHMVMSPTSCYCGWDESSGIESCSDGETTGKEAR